jgi:hypothetical protein
LGPAQVPDSQVAQRGPNGPLFRGLSRAAVFAGRGRGDCEPRIGGCAAVKRRQQQHQRVCGSGLEFVAACCHSLWLLVACDLGVWLVIACGLLPVAGSLGVGCVASGLWLGVWLVMACGWWLVAVGACDLG